jgi:hypothetical protein
MGARDERVDAYIAKAPAFAQPILAHLRGVVHAACPEAEETIKWGMPHFLHHDGILCGMAAFKAHCSFWFWKPAGVVPARADSGDEGMGQFGRITKITDLPSKRALTSYIRAAMKQNEERTAKPVRRVRTPKPPARVPADFQSALAARDTTAKFGALSPSSRREYVEWITGAKRSETRERRIRTAVEWIAEGKTLNWRYEKR